MQVKVLSTEEREEWDSYAQTSQEGTVYHLTAWKGIIENIFGHKTCYIYTKEHDKITGILPLVLMRSLLFGKFIISVPFFNYGGICTSDESARKALLNHAIEIAKGVNAEFIEFRHSKNNDLELPVKLSKVCMVLKLSSVEEVWGNFKSKLRNQIKRPEKAGMIARIGGLEELDNFYFVFARNMRDLGTPVYPKNFFRIILEKFPEHSRICTVLIKDKPVASGFTLGFKDKLEIPWASSLKEYNIFSPNMMLYWNVLQYACKNGYKEFDFGRSTIRGSTYRFKEQWGAKPLQLYWHYWKPNLSEADKLPELNPHNPKFKLAIKTWQRLPLWLTNAIGPLIVKYLP
ncbi:MAG TPA: FemAB family XrtA/PEP-CTERM system-associated protein [Candidatus Brocadiia bacterium]|nr:FemAB family PEP-CTERM system-associated protein [Planctomycetota bacterium]MDO8092513.1 FemAB family PEP-CTERM system-associated protein [Candidatus Brocadiales bacterium]